MICKRCGQSVSDDVQFCPYCGAEMEQEIIEADEGTPAKNVFAIIGFICGIVSLALCWVPFEGFQAIPGIIFCNIGKDSMDHGEKAKRGLPLNVAALIINIILTIVFYVVIIAIALSAE